MSRERGMMQQSFWVKEHMWRWVSGFKFSRKESEDTCGTLREKTRGLKGLGDRKKT